MLRVSPQKLNLVAQMIRGKKVASALADLQFSRKRIAKDVRKCLQSAIANAENNHSLDVDDLVVADRATEVLTRPRVAGPALLEVAEGHQEGEERRKAARPVAILGGGTLVGVDEPAAGRHGVGTGGKRICKR